MTDAYPNVPWLTRTGALVTATGPYLTTPTPVDYTVPPWDDQDAADAQNTIHTIHTT